MSASRNRTYVTIAFAIIILIPSMAGFVIKFFEFVQTFRGEAGGIFAITPMVNYLLASLGFLCMLIWATTNGMFRDLEGPKFSMLDREQELDRVGRDHVPSSRS